MESLIPEISFSGICASLIFSAIGFWIFKQGRVRLDFRLVGLGIVMMAYTYFTHGPLQDWGVGFALCGVAYYLW